MPVEMVPEFWRNARIYMRPIGVLCKKCGARFFPPRKVCLKCGSRELEEYNLPETGKLISWSVVRYPPSEFAYFAPYILGLIELDDGTRIIAQITDAMIEELKPGMRVKMTVRRAFPEEKSGVIRYVYKFRPLIEGEE